jgi:hypothetical protein
MYMKKYGKNVSDKKINYFYLLKFNINITLFLLLLLTIIRVQCKQRYIRTSLA